MRTPQIPRNRGFCHTLLTLSCCALVLLPSLSAKASGVLPSALFDTEETAWASRRDMTYAQWQAEFQSKKGRYLLTDMEVTNVGGSLRYGAVWKRNTSGRKWAVLNRLTSAGFSSAWSQYRADGYILTDQEAYLVNGSQRYSAVFVKNEENVSWGSSRNMTSASFNSRLNWARRSGHIFTDFEVYKSPSGQDRLSAIWVRNTAGISWTLRRALSSSGYSTVFSQLSGSYRVVDFESYRVGSAQRYGAIFYRNTGGRYWKQRRDLTAKQFGDTWKRYFDAGYRLTDYGHYRYGSGYRYSGVWRQNSDRPAWQHRAAVDELLEDMQSDFNVPGMSVAVMQGGTALYLRGVGEADMAANRIATSDTVYRLASVSKGIAGALALDLDERNRIDLADPASDYIPGLPGAHTHSVAQAATMRAGIGHYGSHTTPDSGPYATALAPASELWGVAPVRSVGSYGYSTHSYTYLGAAIEGALGDDLFSVLEDEWRSRYGLGSVRPERMNNAVAERAQIYTTSNTLIANRDDLSWKVLGGGLEGSAKDVARLFDRMQRGHILSGASLETLWTPVVGSTGYGYGVSTTNNWACTRRVAKAGGQSGANAYLLMYPELGVTVVVLSNRWKGGHSSRAVADGIGALIRSTDCP